MKDIIDRLKNITFHWGECYSKPERGNTWNIKCSYFWQETKGVRSIYIRLERTFDHRVLSENHVYYANSIRTFNVNCEQGIYIFRVLAELESGELIDTGITSSEIQCGNMELKYQLRVLSSKWTEMSLLFNTSNNQLRAYYAEHLWIKYDKVFYPYPIEFNLVVPKCCVPATSDISLWTDIKGTMQEIKP